MILNVLGLSTNSIFTEREYANVVSLMFDIIT